MTLLLIFKNWRVQKTNEMQETLIFNFLIINLIKLLAKTHLKLDVEIIYKTDHKDSKIKFNFNQLLKNN